MDSNLIHIQNWIAGTARPATLEAWLDKLDPHTGALQSRVCESSHADVSAAVDAAWTAQSGWAALTPVRRGQVLGEVAVLMRRDAAALAACVAAEAGKPPQDARGEVAGAILQAEYWAGEGMRLHGRSLTSGMVGRQTWTLRQAHGVAGLIVPANTPIANLAWKIFPALLCGNTVVVKAAEDTPRIAMLMAQLAAEAGVPPGVLNIIQGRGATAGAALVEHPRVPLISFTGSTAVGRWIAETAGRRLARVSLELGGKNPFVVCGDADLDHAVHWAALSAFSNAGQRCASGSRLIVDASVYDDFRDRLLARTQTLRLGVTEGCDLGPVINARQRTQVLAGIDQAVLDGGRILCGGGAPADPALAHGWYVQPTVIDGLPASADLNCRELFGPVTTLTKVADFDEAVRVANASDYGLTAAIHTRDLDRALTFGAVARAGLVNVNLGTFGSEPHMPFGGVGASGNGTREPGLEALDVYSELKTMSVLVRLPHGGGGR